MANKDSWTCRNCKTFNLGMKCTTCGTMRGTQANNSEINLAQAVNRDVSEWRCPKCDVKNTHNTCKACGYTR